MHSRADTAAPAKSAVAEGAGVLPLLGEALGSELVGVGEVCFVQVDYLPLTYVSKQAEEEKLTAPERRNDGAPLRNEHPLVDVVRCAGVRRSAEDSDRSPPERLGCDGLDVL